MNLYPVHDPQENLTVLVDLDTFRALGPAVPGESGPHILAGFVGEVGHLLDGVSPDGVFELFTNWANVPGNLPEGPPESDPQTVSAPPSGDDGAGAALAQHEAQNAGDGPPPAQPADSDPTATAGPTPSAPSADSQAEPAANGEPVNGEQAPAGESAPTTTAPAEAAAPATVTTTPCPNCSGTGEIPPPEGVNAPAMVCPFCDGSKVVEVTS